ncbi:YitT family protein [Acholeplasma hippikon]|nr:YitT family protein [Acholeplasma hippikon]
MNKKKLVAYMLITLGVLIINLGFYFFLQPLNLIIGGMMGVVLLIESFIPLTVGTAYLILNVLSLIIGLIFLGKDFFMKTAYATILGPIIVSAMELLEIPDLLVMNQIDTHYQLLVGAIAGGVLVGLGLAIVLRTGATTGGMDVYQKLIHKYLRLPFTVTMYFTDGLIILLGMALNLQSGLFAILSMLMMTLMIEKISVIGRSAFAILIITDFAEEIKDRIFKDIDRGITRAKVTGGYSNKEKEMVITTVTRQELYELKDIILDVDPGAFTLILNTKEVLGLGFHRDEIS